MKYKLLLGKNEITIDGDEKDFFVNNQDKKFVALKSGELVNVAFVQGIIIDHEASRQERKEIMMLENTKENQQLLERKSGNTSELLKKYKPEFLKNSEI